MEPIIQLQNVSKTFKVLNRREGLKGGLKDLFSRDYKTVHAVNDISMKIMQGEIVGYLGPNGAGKSTTIKMMTGILEPSQGEIWVNGVTPYKHRRENAQKIGVVFGQRSQLWWALPLIESFKVLRDIYEVSESDYKEMLALYDSLIDLSELYHKPVRQMSLGQRTLSDILAAFLHNPSVVYLDEPTIGLDVSMKSKIRELIKALNKEKKTTVVLTTHDMGDVDALCKRIVIIDKGNLLYDNDIHNLRKFFGAYRMLKIKFAEQNQALAQVIQQELKAVYAEIQTIEVEWDEEWINLLFKEDEITMMDLLAHLQNNRKIEDMKMEEISTEDVIKKIYEGGIYR